MRCFSFLFMKIHAVGGYGIVGRNMTLYEFEDFAIVVDIGLHLDNYIAYTEAEPKGYIDREILQKIGAVPDLKTIKDKISKVKAIIITHGHLDHVGAVQFLEREFDAPIITTPLTAEILRALAKDTKTKIKNKIITVKTGGKVKINNELTIEFIRAAHSIPESNIIAFHTKKGTYLHATDFKFDNNPIVGNKTDIKRLEELKGKIISLVLDTLHADRETKTSSEKVAEEMLKDVLFHKELEDKGIIVTTFSSHMARLKTIYTLARKLNRKLVFVGRSLEKYITAAKNVNLIEFYNAEIIGYSGKIKKRLKEIEKEGKEKYLIVATGHQGEPGSVLDRIAKNQIKINLHDNDAVVFSCNVIPAPQNVKNRERLESILKSHNVRLFKDVHVSGHLSQEDHRFFIELTQPKIILPTHSDIKNAKKLIPIVEKLGYDVKKQYKILKEGENIDIDKVEKNLL